MGVVCLKNREINGDLRESDTNGVNVSDYDDRSGPHHKNPVNPTDFGSPLECT